MSEQRRKTAIVRQVTIVGLLLCAWPARADDVAAARALFKKAALSYRLGRFKEALADFEEVLKRRRRASVIFNIAQCHRQLGNNARALFFYRLYLTEAARENPTADPPNEAEVKEHIASLQRLVDEARARREQKTHTPAQPGASSGRVYLTGVPDGAMVLVGGVVRAQAPLTAPIEVAVGDQHLRVRAAGYVPWTRTIQVTPGGVYRERVTMRRPVRRSRGWLIAGLATGGAAVGALAVGIIFNVNANATDDPETYDRHRAASTAGYVVGGVLTAAAAACLTLHLVRGREAPRSHPPDPVGAAVLPLPGGAVLATGGRF